MRKASLFLIVVFIISCVGGGKYYRPYDELEPEEVASEAHYVYADSNLALAARLINMGVLGSFGYQFIIWNIGDNPIQLNYVYDVVSMKYKKSVYILDKMTNIQNYPDYLNPKSYTTLHLKIDSRFNDTINQIESLTFQHNTGQKYLLVKNPKAKWE